MLFSADFFRNTFDIVGFSCFDGTGAAREHKQWRALWRGGLVRLMAAQDS
jgi:hypothetical protein